MISCKEEPLKQSQQLHFISN